ncbi:hypothetical protein ACFL3C_01190 [Patescibacteria group bacterium]
MFTKIFFLVLVRIFELIVLVVTSLWMWNNFPEGIKLWTILGFIFAYFVYLAVTFSNDYREIRYGEGEPMM